jgi:hypothetical protein
VVPGGIVRSSVWETAVTCATAAAICVFGWKYTLITPTPGIDWDSMCLDVVDAGREGTLCGGDDARFHVVDGQARQRPDDADDRDVDLGEDVRRGPHHGYRAEQHDEQHHHHERIRPT